MIALFYLQDSPFLALRSLVQVLFAGVRRLVEGITQPCLRWTQAPYKMRFSELRLVVARR